MTTIETLAPPNATATVHVGQTWHRIGAGYRDVIVAVVEPEEGAPHILHRIAHEEIGAALDATPVDVFLARYEDPQWLPLPPVERVEYVAMIDAGPGPLYDMEPRDSLSDAYRRAVEARGANSVIGVQKVTTTQTYEWVTFTEGGVVA